MTRRLVLLAAALAVLLAAAGCGGGGGGGERLTKAQYEAKVAAIAKEIGDKLGKATSGEPSKEDLAKAQKAIRAFADELDHVNPPADVESIHKDFVGGMRQLADDLGDIFDQLDKAKDPAEAIAALFGAKSIQTLSRVQQELKKKGYELDLGD